MKSEYEILREEIMDHYKAINQYNIALYTTVSAIFAFFSSGVEKTEYYVFLIPFIVIVPLYLACEEKHRSVCKLAAYLIVFLEGNDYNWERRHQRYSLKQMEKWKKESRPFTEIASYYILVVTCCSFSIYKLSQVNYSKNGFIVRVVIVILLTFFMLVIMKRRTIVYATERSKMIEEWIRIKEIKDTYYIVKTEKEIYHIIVTKDGG